jgi:hypothetical protein
MAGQVDVIPEVALDLSGKNTGPAHKEGGPRVGASGLPGTGSARFRSPFLHDRPHLGRRKRCTVDAEVAQQAFEEPIPLQDSITQSECHIFVGHESALDWCTDFLDAVHIDDGVLAIADHGQMLPLIRGQ